MREHGRPSKRRAWDTDSAQRVRAFQLFVWALPSALLGGFIGWLASSSSGATAGAILAWFLLGALLGFILVFGVSWLVIEFGGELAGILYNPSGRTTPSRPEYSYPASLVARGRIDEAIVAYERACVENPDDPEPRLRLARVLRDELRRYDDAIAWFRKARDARGAGPGEMTLATREIFEICRDKLGAPLKAAPDLARLAERLAGTPSGAWALRELEAARVWMDTTLG